MGRRRRTSLDRPNYRSCIARFHVLGYDAYAPGEGFGMAITQSDAIEFIVEKLRNPPTPGPVGLLLGINGYDLYVPHLLHYFGIERLGLDGRQNIGLDPKVIAESAAFYDAIWTLCRRGVLRPTILSEGRQPMTDGKGFSLTELGQRWLANEDRGAVLSDPSRFGSILEKYAKLFGPGFLRRAHEAIKCHDLGAYLACCSMAGAAAEAILLDVAVAKNGDREAVLKLYLARGGRKSVTNTVLASVTEPLASQLKTLLDLLNYWRDTAAHGDDHEYTEIEAYDAISRLLRLAMLVGDNWQALTGKPS